MLSGAIVEKTTKLKHLTSFSVMDMAALAYSGGRRTGV
jgi:hypothetical protein